MVNQTANNIIADFSLSELKHSQKTLPLYSMKPCTLYDKYISYIARTSGVYDERIHESSARVQTEQNFSNNSSEQHFICNSRNRFSVIVQGHVCPIWSNFLFGVTSFQMLLPAVLMYFKSFKSVLFSVLHLYVERHVSVFVLYFNWNLIWSNSTIISYRWCHLLERNILLWKWLLLKDITG